MFITVARAAKLILPLAFALSVATAQATPQTYAPASTETLSVPCAERYGQPTFAPEIPANAKPSQVVERLFEARPTYGFPENLSIEGDGSTPGAYFHVRYPKGSVAPSVKKRPTGGMGFYTNGNLKSGAAAACLRYLVRFPESFNFRAGGKLPGLFGGKDAPSGGARPKGDDGFTVRLMWRTKGDGELYLYAPNMVPDSRRGGQRLGTGQFRFHKGAWTEVQLETILNTPGKSDGLIALWVDRKPAIFAKGIRFRKSGRLPVGGLMFSTFFGGNTARFAASKTEYADFTGFRLYSATREQVLAEVTAAP